MNKKRLSRLAELRRRIRDRQSAVSADAQARLTEGELALDRARAEREAFEEEARRAMLAMTNIDEIWMLQRRARLHDAHVEANEGEVEQRRALSDAARAELRSLTKDVKVAERVLERLEAAALQAALRRERRLVDDIVGAEAGGQP